MKIIPASDSSLMVTFGDAISSETSERVLGLFHALRAMSDNRIRNLHPGYTSLLVDFDPLAVSHEEVAVIAGSLARGGTSAPENLSKVVELPVCYDAEFGPDLADVAAHTGVSTEEVIRLHSGATYRVCFLGIHGGLRLSRRHAGGTANAATGHAAAHCCPRQRGHCGPPDRHLSGRNSRRVALDWTHSTAHVRSAVFAANKVAGGRPGTVWGD